MNLKARHMKMFDRLTDWNSPKTFGRVQAGIRGFRKYTGNTRPRLKRKLLVEEARKMCYESQKM